MKVAITCKICQLLETYLCAHWILMKAVWSWERWAVRPYSSYFLQGPPALAPPAQPTVHPNKKRKVSTCHTAKYQAYFNICAKKKKVFINTKTVSTSSNVSPEGLEIASLISWATSCCSVISAIRSSIFPKSLRMRVRVKEGERVFTHSKHRTCFLN